MSNVTHHHNFHAQVPVAHRQIVQRIDGLRGAGAVCKVDKANASAAPALII